MAMADEELLWVRIGLGQDVNRFAKSLGSADVVQPAPAAGYWSLNDG